MCLANFFWTLQNFRYKSYKYLKYLHLKKDFSIHSDKRKWGSIQIFCYSVGCVKTTSFIRATTTIIRRITAISFLIFDQQISFDLFHSHFSCAEHENNTHTSVPLTLGVYIITMSPQISRGSFSYIQ